MLRHVTFFVIDEIQYQLILLLPLFLFNFCEWNECEIPVTEFYEEATLDNIEKVTRISHKKNFPWNILKVDLRCQMFVIALD